ncbi:MAG: TRAP transporter small permease subunit [Burkholderiales bacterium]|nr:TRAP transporter small permease subunit [Burkholderiales bacterium]
MLFAFLANAYLSFWREWPGAGAAFGADAPLLAWVQVALYVLAVAGPATFVSRTRERSLRQDDAVMARIAAYIAAFAFWCVLLVGIADAVISFLRVEGLLEGVFGHQLAQDLGRNHFRAPYVHGPLIIASLVIAALSRSLGFTWLALLVVVAELQIVITRFVFSYEQAFMSDLVRMWYAGLFLFSSAYTLIEEGHVRVDVFYTNFSNRKKGLVNAVGSAVLGLPLCWIILILGMGDKTSIITSPLLALEVTQSGYGMYIKYLMAAFLAIFAATMMIQFSAYFLESVADYRGDSGKHKTEPLSTA